MRLVRINESAESLNELFGRKSKKTANSKQGINRVQREIYSAQDVKKWLSQSRYTGKDLAEGFQGINDTASVSLEGNRNIGVALYHTKRGNAMVVAKGVGAGNSVGDLWIKHDLFSGEGSWSKVFDAFLKCENMNDVDAVCRKYKFSNQKVH